MQAAAIGGSLGQLSHTSPASHPPQGPLQHGPPWNLHEAARLEMPFANDVATEDGAGKIEEMQVVMLSKQAQLKSFDL